MNRRFEKRILDVILLVSHSERYSSKIFFLSLNSFWNIGACPVFKRDKDFRGWNSQLLLFVLQL